MRVFRLEHAKSKYGPWNGPGFGWGLNDPILRNIKSALSGMHTTAHPNLHEDWPEEHKCKLVGSFGILPREYDKHFCGMPSLDATKHWFDGVSRKHLKKAGYVFRVYEVPDEDVVMGKSGTQVFFKREREVLIEEKESLDEIEAA